jgi:ABC-2 type transport system permease protein
MNTFTILRKELSSYFRSPVAYAVLFFFALITGFFFWAGVRAFLQQSLQMTMMGQSVPLNVNEFVVRNVLSNMNVINLFVIPIITMRLFAEEKRTGTFELLATSPLRDGEIILGKWLAAMVLYLAGLGITVLNMLVLFAYGNPDWRPMAVGYLGVILQGGCLLAIGTFLSTLTKNQIIAAMAAFGVCLLLFVLDWVSSFESSALFRVISYRSVSSHFDAFSRGVLDAKDAMYYVTMIILGLFLSARSLESIRWRA